MGIKKVTRYISIVALLLAILTGCGEGNGKKATPSVEQSSEPSTTANSVEQNRDSDTEESTIESNVTKTKGYLIDSPIEGAEYFCADGGKGFTDSNGTFECEEAPVVFKIGGLTIGTLTEFTADGKVYPQDLLGLDRTNYTDIKLKLLARLLQSIDDDGDIKDKITITPNIRADIDTVYDFENMSLGDVRSLLLELGKKLVSEDSAMNHLRGYTPSVGSGGGFSGGGSSSISSINKTHKKTYSYDSTNRVTKEDLGNGSYIEYIYDDSGNLISQQVIK